MPLAAQAHKGVPVNAIDYKIDFHLMKLNIYYFNFAALINRQSVALSSATSHAMPPEFIGKRGTEVYSSQWERSGLTLVASFLIRGYIIFLSFF